MDSQNFDRLARVIGGETSRRRMLKALAGGALGAAAASIGLADASAHQKRSVGNSCSVNADCASNLCVTEGRTRKICHCASPGDCPRPAGQCQIATCSAGACGSAINVGGTCDDGDACTFNDVCQADGSCAGTPATCPSGTTPCGACGADCCAAGLFCVNGSCTDCRSHADCVSANPCLGGSCTSAGCQYSPINEAQGCGGTHVCQAGVCCVPDGEPFGDGAPCCSGSVANPNGTQVCGTLASCIADGGACVPGAYCCGGVCGSGGSCCTPDGQPAPTGTVCCSGTTSNPGNGPICGPLPCTPTTCAAQGVSCGQISDGCSATLECGSCSNGHTCQSGQCVCPSGSISCGGSCERGYCCVDIDCADRGECYERHCNFRQVGQGFRNVCHYTHIPNCCNVDSDCALGPCDASLSCDVAAHQCVHVSACSGCNVCNLSTGTCSNSNCSQCQYCEPGGVCKTDDSRAYQACGDAYVNGQYPQGICSEGECVTCISNDRPCQGIGYDDECCSGKCRPDINGGLGDYVCTCRTLIEYCDNDAQCCQGNCAPGGSGMKTCQA